MRRRGFRCPAPSVSPSPSRTWSCGDRGREVGEHLYNPIGVVHGGVAATLLDSVAASAVHSVLPAGTGYTSLDLSAKFLRPILADTGPLRAIGTVINRGRRTALANAELRDSTDRLLAHATSSCMLFPTDA
nr:MULTISPECIES: PaaI family thioesterase [Kribbella]